MKAAATFREGEVIIPLPRDISVKCDQLLLPDGITVRHGEDFNATIISHFLVAVKPLCADAEIILNFNLAFYDMTKSGAASDTFVDPVVPGFRYLSETEKQVLYLYADESVRHEAVVDGFIPHGTESGIDVLRARKRDLISVAKRDQTTGSVVFESTGVLLPFPVRSTVELPGDMHLRLTGGSEFMRHSCLPNLRLEIAGDQLRGVALRPIEAGERLTFNYLCTEWEMTKVFHCSCNVYSCYGIIRGFKYLDRQQQEHLLPNCSPAVQEKHCAPLLAAASLTALGAGSALATAADGRIVAQHHVPAGTVLFNVGVPPRIQGSELALDGFHLRHSCDATTVLLEGRLVTARALATGDALSYNLNLLAYRLPAPFACDCGSAKCCRGEVKGLHALPAEEKSRLWILADSAVRADAVKDGYDVTCASPLVKVLPNGFMGDATFAARNIPAGSRIFHLTGLVLPFPTVYTIYLGEGKHLLFGDGGQCLAHSCKPNARIVVDPTNGLLDCFATEDIASDAVISFNYLETEWDMDEPFTCICGNHGCFGRIEGYRHLSTPGQLRLWPTATKAIRTLFAQTCSAGSVLSTLNTDLIDVTSKGGELCASQELPSGTVLFECRESFRVIGNKVYFNDVAVAHSCNATAAFMEGRVVLARAVAAGTLITLNVNQLVYKLAAPFDCACGAEDCVGSVAGFHGLSTERKDALLLCTLYGVRAAAIDDGYQNKSGCPLVDPRANGEMGQATFAAKPIAAGTRFFRVSGLVLPFPTVYTILLEPGRHLLFAGGAQCLAHDCNPNVRVMVDPESRSLDCLALRDIAEGEVISFNYLATEWDMSTPFRCVCQSPDCFGKISGFKHLSHLNRQKLWGMATPAIRTLAQTSRNWKLLASPALSTDGHGCVRAARVLHEGAVVLSADRVEFATGAQKGCIVVDEILLRHSCNASAAVVENRVVLLESVCPGAEITVNLCCLAYTLEAPFTCGGVGPEAPASAHAAHEVVGFAGLVAADRARLMMVTAKSVRTEAVAAEGYQVPCSCPLVEVRANAVKTVGQEAYAAAPITIGVRFLRVKGLALSFPTPYTVMLSEHRHLLLTDGAQCITHSCDPNTRLSLDANTGVVECEAIRNIAAGERVTFNYNATEWAMHTSFLCKCGAPSCVYDISGFKHLTVAQRAALADQVTPAVRQLAQLYANVQLDPKALRPDPKTGALCAAAATAAEAVLMEVRYMDIQPRQICVGRGYVIPHRSADYNCVLVEGRIVTARPMAAGEPLSVNMNYFVYDMTALFPRAFSEDCMGFKHMEDADKQTFLYLCEPPVRAQAMRDGWLVKSSQQALKIFPRGAMGQTAYAAMDILAGMTLFHCTGLIVPFPTMYTICVGRHKHLLFGDAAECIAHSCDPNVQVVANQANSTFDFVAIKPIAKEELVTFNYNTTEWDMNSKFECLCGSPLCAKSCQGFKHLTNADRQRLWPITSAVVKDHCKVEEQGPQQ